MFSKKNNKVQKSFNESANVNGARSVPSILSADLRIVGNLNSEGEIQIDGFVDGDIHTKVLLIGKSAEINGNLFAEAIQVHGTINGNIKAKSVVLAKTARILGDVSHEDLSIEKGAFLEGHCKSATYSTPEKEPTNVVFNRSNVTGTVPVSKDFKATIGATDAKLTQPPPKKSIGA